jgi:hypothetical protein
VPNAPDVSFASFSACVLAAVLATAPAGAQTQPQKTVTSAADLPAFTYPIDLAPSLLVQADDATFNAFAAQVRTNVESVLAGYDIQDHATLRALLQQELQLETLSGTEDAAAVATAQRIRALEDKPDTKLISGLLTEALATARARSGASSGPAYLAALGQAYAAKLAPLPWPVVGALLEQIKTTYEVFTPAMVIGQLTGSIDPAALKSHAVGDDAAAHILTDRYFLKIVIPEGPTIAAVIGALVAQHTVHKPDIWAARDVTLHAGDRLTPVRIAVWDSGSDVSMFAHQLYTDPHPQGFDAHGLAFDLYGFKTHGALYPLSPQERAEYPPMLNFLAGWTDMQQSVDSPGATAARAKMTALKPAEVPAFFQLVDFLTDYVHGTHVTGIALRGNPAARLVVARITFDYRWIPTAPTVENTRRDARNQQTYVDYFKAHGVRVVNMSWGGTPAGFELALERNNLGTDAADRKAIAAKLFAIDRAGLYDAIKSAPNILFVCAAGNSDSNSTFDESMPASFDLPNLLVVGAVDQAGDETSFTSYGKTVVVDADGYQIESTAPGGRRMTMSGTSQATPAVTNLAAKLLALDPALTPVQTIALIRAGATASSDGRRHDIDPKRSVELLRARLAAR